MSFDIYLQKFAKGEPAEASREQVLTVLRSAKYSGPDDFGFYVVELADGHDVEFSAKELQGSGKFTNCSFQIHGISSHVMNFIFEIAKAGDMVILPAMQDFIPILSQSEQRKELPEDLAKNEPEPVLCSSSDELGSLLSGGYAGWQEYRDRILNEKRGI